MTSNKLNAVKLGSGRIIETSEDGDPDGVPVFFLHGTPGSRLLFGPHAENAKRRGIRLVGYSRPGYGGSTRVEGRRIADGASDVVEIADSLGFKKFAVLGFSGGGDYALACAALIPDRVAAAASLSTLAPYGIEGFDFYSGMGEYNAEDYKLMLSNRPEWEAKSKRDSEVLAKLTKEDRTKMVESLLSEVDKKVNTDEVDGFFQSQFEDGLRNGVEGSMDDQVATAVSWGFSPSSISIPLQIWHGKEDRFVPFSHGQYLVSVVPQAEAHLEENEGHISMFVNRIPEIQAWLASKL